MFFKEKSKLGFKTLELAEKHYPIGTMCVKYVPSEYSEAINTAKEIFDFSDNQIPIKEGIWKEATLKPGSILDFGELKKELVVTGYYFDGEAYWPVESKYDKPIKFVYIDKDE